MKTPAPRTLACKIPAHHLLLTARIRDSPALPEGHP
jgi:hypothetical protein